MGIFVKINRLHMDIAKYIGTIALVAVVIVIYLAWLVYQLMIRKHSWASIKEKALSLLYVTIVILALYILWDSGF